MTPQEEQETMHEKQKPTGIIKAGMAVIISCGRYSDYSFGQVYIALKDFNYVDEAKKCFFEYLDARSDEDKEDGYVNTFGIDFEVYLIRNGFLGLCENREIHTGDYEFFNEDEWLEEWEKINEKHRR